MGSFSVVLPSSTHCPAALHVLPTGQVPQLETQPSEDWPHTRPSQPLATGHTPPHPSLVGDNAHGGHGRLTHGSSSHRPVTALHRFPVGQTVAGHLPPHPLSVSTGEHFGHTRGTHGGMFSHLPFPLHRMPLGHVPHEHPRADCPHCRSPQSLRHVPPHPSHAPLSQGPHNGTHVRVSPHARPTFSPFEGGQRRLGLNGSHQVLPSPHNTHDGFCCPVVGQA